MGARLSADLFIGCQSCVPSPRPLQGLQYSKSTPDSIFLNAIKYLRSRPRKETTAGTRTWAA